MNVFDLIKKLAGGDNKVLLETYLQAAKQCEIPFPLTPVKDLIGQGKIVLDRTNGSAFLVVAN